ncbi:MULTISPECIES: SDR family oxidoreductase [unclassified Roseateles]|uniref:SDR family oxidoreductase n=1 Tax=unclassified Roseateles TaxID=2626991 RepID=UPI0006F6B268|nr:MULTISPECIES: SDR family oxidoreductase [unclassified Roseateles]KQW43279.1 hypothetical protein ASC81_15900 [Pelomonas sp. Root405]KRA71017.1 hypothetical protein ASD88_14425 [Pelomonas sp. Root662]
MKIMLTGATGFLGGRLLRQLLAAGHQVVCAGRSAPRIEHGRCGWLKLDFAATPAAVWVLHLQGVDVVVNLVGIFRESGAASFAAVHTRGPQALFDACASAGVRRVVQVSALGADAQAETEFLRSKYGADRHLLALPLDGCVAQPSLVFAPDGLSARRLLTLACLPVVPLPAGGRQRIQPIHVDDAVDALHALVEWPGGDLRGRRVPLVGPRPLMLQDYLLALRRGMGFAPGALVLPLPAWLMAVAAWLGDHQPRSLFNRAAWAMLQHGNTGDATLVARLLGRSPRPASAFIPNEQRAAVRTQAQLAWLLPLLRLSLAAVWLATAAVSAGLYPVELSHQLLGRAGVPAELQPAALWGAVALDLLLGLLTLWPMRSRRWLWLTQAGLILFYSVVISVSLPEFWLHPYGPMTKNLPMLALLLLLWQLEPRRGER